MELGKYRPYWTKDYLMGPNSLRILQELMERNPCSLGGDSLILDLGCGTGLTSFALCLETGAKVLANDLWISGEENAVRFDAWGVGDRVNPVHENADNLRFEKECFDAIVSIDSYHYFAGKEGYFQEKILPFLKPGGVALFGVPGIREEFDTQTEALLSPWLGEEAYMFHNANYLEASYIPGVSEQLQDEMTGAWVAFAKSGNPNHVGMPVWHETTEDNGACMIFDRVTREEYHHDDELMAALPPKAVIPKNHKRRPQTRFGGGPRQSL
jgi:cyclopropane fatty-acyl-phospholipid synthase-like methyltransferase